jgi:hypothetical protein
MPNLHFAGAFLINTNEKRQEKLTSFLPVFFY